MEAYNVNVFLQISLLELLVFIYKPNFNAYHRYCHKDQIKEYISILLRMLFDKNKWKESVSLDLCYMLKDYIIIKSNCKFYTWTVFCTLSNDGPWAAGISGRFVTSVITVWWTITDECLVDTSYSPWFTSKPSSWTKLLIHKTYHHFNITILIII